MERYNDNASLISAGNRVMSSAWAMDGLQNILIRGLGLQSVGLPALVLLAYALSLFTLACGDLRGWMRDNYP